VQLCEHAGLLEQLAHQDAPRSWDDPFATIRQRRRAVAEGSKGNEQGTGTVAPTEIVRALAAIMPSNTIVTTDVGSHKYLFGQFWPSREPDTFFMSNGLSGMGYGLPAAIGAKLARPASPVLAAIGDGGFSMNSQELETAKRYGAEIIVVVLSDNSYSLIRHAQAARGLPHYGVDFTPIDTVRTAEACGFAAARVASGDELAERVSAAVGRGEGLVVEVPVDVNDYHGLV
jgi:acetolactate synthase-1/2/3 large subunit